MNTKAVNLTYGQVALIEPLIRSFVEDAREENGDFDQTEYTKEDAQELLSMIEELHKSWNSELLEEMDNQRDVLEAEYGHLR